MINFKKKFVFIHIPKTAGTSIESSLDEGDSILKRGETEYGYARPLNHLTLTQALNHRDVDPNITKDFFKFTFVRNPWDKVISECFCGQIQVIFKDDHTIKEKIKTACSWAKGGYGGHCQKQIDFVKAQGSSMDFIGRFEDLQKDYKHICETLKIPHLPLPHLNKSKRSHYREYFNNETEDLVRETYKEDIEKFNYEY